MISIQKIKRTSLENISPITTHGMGPKPNEKAEIYNAMRISGRHEKTVSLSANLWLMSRYKPKPKKLTLITTAEIINNTRRPALSTTVIATNVIISFNMKRKKYY
jgi:hypothetical protein